MSFYSVVRFDGFRDRRWILYRHPVSGVTNNSKLIVGLDQTGIVVVRGKIEKIFESGTYDVNSVNFPFLYTYSKRTQEDGSFDVGVYFYNKAIRLSMLWGTKEPIIVTDPQTKNKIRIRARGQYILKIVNFQSVIGKLIQEVSGNNLLEYNKLADFLRDIISFKLSELLEEFILKYGNSLSDIGTYTKELSKECFNKLKADFRSYGLELETFFVDAISIFEDDLKNVGTPSFNKEEVVAEKKDFTNINKDYDSFGSLSKNKGFGESSVAAIVKTEEVKSAINTTSSKQEQNKDQPECPRCGKVSEGSPYCRYCGSPMKITCPLCNHEVAKEDINCSKCGTRLSR